MDNDKELLEAEAEIKKLNREIRRLKKDNELLRIANNQAMNTRAYIQRDNNRQMFYKNQLLKTYPYMLILTDDELRTVMTSDVFFDYNSTYSREEIGRGVALRDALDDVLSEKDLNYFMVMCQAAMAGRAVEPYILRNSKNGRKTDWQITIRRIHMEGRVTGLNIVFVDITAMVDALDRAKAADKAKSNFLANMSHEIRTPMNSISGMSELIIRDSDDDNVKRQAMMIKSASRSLLAIINDILDYSKIESGKMELRPEDISMASLVSDIVMIIKIRLKDKTIEFKTDIDKNIPSRARVDEVRIKQILVNLLGNAVKFTQTGYIKLGMKLKKSDDTNDHLSMYIEDTGTGIRPENLEKIFSSFTQVDTKRNRAVEGTGLGLAISKELAELMGGSISVESEYGKGTTFRVDIPLDVTDPTPIGDISDYFGTVKAEVFEPSFKALGSKILVVDDNEMNLEVASGILAPYDADVTCVSSGAKAIEIFGEKQYDIVFMDHMMPGMDGVEAMNRLRALPGGDRVTYIALTANAVEGVEDEYRAMGFMDYLPKPIEPNRLDAMLKKHLGQDRIVETDISHSCLEIVNNVTDKEREDDMYELIDVETGLKYCMGKKDFYRSVLEVFAETSSCDELDELYTKENWKDYRNIVHAVKGTALTIGAVNLSEKAKGLNQAAKDNDTGYIKAHHEDFIKEYREVVKYIEDGKVL